MEITSITALIIAIKSVVSLLNDISLGNIKLKYRLNGDQKEHITKFPEINSMVGELILYFNKISVATAQIHIFANKLTELINSKSNLFKQKDESKRDTQWEIMQGQLNYLSTPISELTTIVIGYKPYNKSSRIDEISRLAKLLSSKFDIAQSNIRSRDIEQLKSVCADMALFANEIKGLSLKYLQELLSA